MKYVWPDDLELLQSAAAAKMATAVANENAARDPFIEALAARLQPKLPARPEPKGEVVMLMTFRDYGRRTSYSETFIKRLVPRGLPTVGKHKARRVHVARADRWLEDNLDLLDITDSPEIVELAKANARRARTK